MTRAEYADELDAVREIVQTAAGRFGVARVHAKQLADDDYVTLSHDNGIGLLFAGLGATLQAEAAHLREHLTQGT